MDADTISDDDRALGEAVAAAIRAERLRLGFDTNAELADHYGIYQKHLSYWANGRFNTLDRVLARILTNYKASEPQVTP